nr:cutinase transcription factor 1 beta [Quercus suber]
MNLQRLGIAPPTADPRPLLPQLLDMPTYSLPAYIKPLHNRLTPDDILYLERKGALTLPPDHLRDELLRCYVEFVHPYMPLLDLHDTIHIIDKNDGERSISLLLFQAIMFAGVATVDIRYLKAAGYATRRDARRLFFQKTRLLYDFDYEVDRISLIQSLLLMTYWYETPDDQKDSHHWMGIAVSLSHTIGLHRNPEKSTSMAVQRQRLWKRIWWSTYMRDRLIALGMRRPTRIKGADFDVPMLTVEDFEDAILPDGPSCIPAGCSLVRSKEKQRQLAILCIEKAKLCLCISHVLSVQYSVLNSNHGVISEEGSTKTTMMLMAKRLEPEQDQLQSCDQELQDWYNGLAEEAQYVEPAQHDVYAGNEDIVLNRSLLHLIFNATLSALHRPQVLPSTVLPQRNTQGQLDISRKSVRTAANRITSIAHSLHNLDMVRFLPTTGITVLLPAIIIHLLDIKSPDEATRRTSLQGFCQCMQIMAALRDIYAAADYSTAFLEAAIRKAEITLPAKSNGVRESRNIITSAAGLMDAANRLQPSADFSNPQHHHHHHHHTLSASTIPDDARMTPPDSDSSPNNATHDDLRLSDTDMAHQLHHYLASTPPESENQLDEHLDPSVLDPHQHTDFEPDFDSMINLDAAGEIWSVDDGAFAAMQGESGGFAMEVDWMKGMKDDGGFGAIAIPGSPEMAA